MKAALEYVGGDSVTSTWGTRCEIRHVLGGSQGIQSKFPLALRGQVPPIVGEAMHGFIIHKIFNWKLF